MFIEYWQNTHDSQAKSPKTKAGETEHTVEREMCFSKLLKEGREQGSRSCRKPCGINVRPNLGHWGKRGPLRSQRGAGGLHPVPLRFPHGAFFASPPSHSTSHQVLGTLPFHLYQPGQKSCYGAYLCNLILFFSSAWDSKASDGQCYLCLLFQRSLGPISQPGVVTEATLLEKLGCEVIRS